ncbi:MAG: phosphate signaling complex protein PhoU [Candidatus Omnitrophica bacterium]|nr:phosphate signaling complex protein PhoU [Candidatus Omnitrophota bacterium]
MKRHFENDLKKFNTEILKMATLTEEAIYKSVESLKNRDLTLARGVIDDDHIIDEQELLIEEMAIDFLALQNPKARDLRFITTGMSINAELERIADLAVNISQRVLDLGNEPLIKPLIDIPKLTAVVRRMIKDVIDAFVNQDEQLARSVILSDPEADKLRNMIFDELVYEYMVKNGKCVPRAIPLLLITRHLERIADHVTNIAEDIIYMVKAEVVKHHPERLTDTSRPHKEHPE